MGIVIDTSALVSAQRVAAAGTNAAMWESLFEAIGDEPAAMPAIVYAEALAGVELADSTTRAAARRRSLDALVAHVTLVEFDADIAQTWARLFATLRRSGRMIPSNDLAVAATATHLEYAVLVGPDGEKHFRAIEGLTISTIG